MQGPALPIELHSRHTRRRLCQQLHRQIGLSVRIGPADQALVTHWPAMGETENRLEMSEQTKFGGQPALCFYEQGIGARRSQIGRARGVPWQVH